MIELALKLLLAHILGDFVLQPDNWVEKKRKKKHFSTFLYVHLGIHGLALLILLKFNTAYWAGILTILLTHYLIDLLKLHFENKIHKGWAFLLDQFLHLLVILLVVYFYFQFPLKNIFSFNVSTLLLILSVLSVTSVSAIIMKVAMNQWHLPEDDEQDSLPKAGKYIGMIERLMVFTFFVLQQWAAIGWLIAAKSILRFSDLSRAKDRKLTEYVLIGTLLSFGLAIGIGLAYLFLLEKINF